MDYRFPQIMDPNDRWLKLIGRESFSAPETSRMPLRIGKYNEKVRETETHSGKEGGESLGYVLNVVNPINPMVISGS